MHGESGPGARGIRAIEGSASSGWAWTVLLFGLILARNLLEGVLERPHQLGFDWRPELSFGMVFLHFPLFYLTLFLGLTLWLHRLARRPIAPVARVVTLGFALLLIVPVVDALVSRGRGYDLRYLLGLGSVLWRFWDPTAVLGEISPGQRVEILMAVVLSGAYVWSARRAAATNRTPRTLEWGAAGIGGLAAAGVFLIVGFIGAWPSLLARLGSPGAAGWEDAYTAVFRLRGLVTDESRRHAIAIAALFVPGLVGFAWRLNPKRYRDCLQEIRWTRLIHYTGLVPAGALLGWLVYRDPGIGFDNPIDILAVAVLWAGMASAFLAALLWNDRQDLEADRINDPDRARAAGGIPDRERRTLAAVAAGLALFLALCVGYAPFLLMASVLLLAWLYSAPPVRLKRWPGVSTLTLGALSWLSLASGFSLFGQEMTLAAMPGRVGGLLFAGVALAFTAKDLKDAAGDRATGVVTLATLLPDRAARRVTAALVATAYLLGPVLLPLGAGFTVLAIGFAAASAWVTLRRRRPDGALLAGFLIFAAFLLAFLAYRPEVLRERVPPSLRAWHAQTRAVEEDVRIARIVEDEAQAARRLGAVDRRAEIAAALERALARFDAADAGGPVEERLRWARAQIAAWPVARVDLAWLMRVRPLSAEYREASLAAAGRSGDIEAAREICRASIDLGVRPGDFRRNRAALAIGAGEIGPAPAADLAGAFLHGQREPLCQVLLGDLLMRRSDRAGAAGAYARATERDPQLPEAWSGMGEARHAEGDLPGALDAFARARALAPRDPWVLNNEGVVLRDAGRLEEALERFTQAHALAPDLFEPLFNLGLSCERLGRLAEARHWFAAARQLRPGFGPVEEALERVGAPAPGGDGVGERADG